MTQHGPCGLLGIRDVPVIIPMDMGTNGLMETQQYLFAYQELYETG